MANGGILGMGLEGKLLPELAQTVPTGLTTRATKLRLQIMRREKWRV